MIAESHPVSDRQLVDVLTAARLVDHRRSEVVSAGAAVEACNTSAPEGSYAHRLAEDEAARYRNRLIRAAEMLEEAKDHLRQLLADIATTERQV